MINFLKIIIFSLFLMHSQIAFAEDLKSLSFKEAFEIGLANNPNFKAKTKDIDIKVAELKTAKARLNPSIISDNGIAEDTYRAGIAYTIELGGKRKKRTELASTTLDITKKNIDSEWLKLRADIRKAYTDLFYAREKLRVLNDVIENSNKLLKIAGQREQAGDIPNAEVIQAELVNVMDLQEYQNETYRINQLHNQLEYILNIELSEEVELSSPERIEILTEKLDQDENSINSLFELAKNNRPELKSNILSQNLAEQEIRLAKANRIPNLDLSAGPDIVTGDQGQFNAFFTAQIKLPIFNFQGGAIEAAKAQKEKSIHEYEELKNKIKLEVKNAYNDYLYYLRAVENYENNIIPKAKNVIDKTFRSFEVGKSQILVPLNAQRSYMSTELNYIDIQTKYQESINALEMAIGEGL